jgi:hypothetical protein
MGGRREGEKRREKRKDKKASCGYTEVRGIVFAGKVAKMSPALFPESDIQGLWTGN